MAVALPGRATETGAVARLLLAETRGPSYSDYSPITAKQCMGWMKRVLVNRLQNNPKRFFAPGAKTLMPIIKARGQFEGFEHYPNYSAKIVHNLQLMVDIANNTKDGRRKAFEKHILDAVLTATNSEPEDPSETGLYGWRTKGHGSPGSNFEFFKELGGTNFYTLKPS